MSEKLLCQVVGNYVRDGERLARRGEQIELDPSYAAAEESAGNVMILEDRQAGDDGGDCADGETMRNGVAWSDKNNAPRNKKDRWPLLKQAVQDRLDEFGFPLDEEARRAITGALGWGTIDTRDWHEIVAETSEETATRPEEEAAAVEEIRKAVTALAGTEFADGAALADAVRAELGWDAPDDEIAAVVNTLAAERAGHATGDNQDEDGETGSDLTNSDTQA